MNTYFVRKSVADSLILEETFPTHSFFTAYQHQGLIGNDSTCIKRGIGGGGGGS